MTSCKLILRNVRKHIRDYLVYFLTLMISVSLFYAINSISDQTAFPDPSGHLLCPVPEERNPAFPGKSVFPDCSRPAGFRNTFVLLVCIHGLNPSSLDRQAVLPEGPEHLPGPADRRQDPHQPSCPVCHLRSAHSHDLRCHRWRQHCPCHERSGALLFSL